MCYLLGLLRQQGALRKETGEVRVVLRIGLARHVHHFLNQLRTQLRRVGVCEAEPQIRHALPRRFDRECAIGSCEVDETAELVRVDQFLDQRCGSAVPEDFQMLNQASREQK